ncbi:MAG TPA: NfeD family protein [Candidatus Limnocylindrales bacterium]|nr:NfeD family protein [Candidatus Limnocylindrales bacterium]
MTAGAIAVRRHLSRRSRPIATIGALALLLLAVVPASGASRGAVVVLPATGEVDGVMASTIRSGLNAAAGDGAAAVVIRLNTPGGSFDSTQDIVTTILGARVPVIVWVAPAGGYAASAGTFITLSANLAYMAPGTRIGAASPIDANGQDIPGTLGDKVKNDAIAWIMSIAGVRHRPTDWAASTVRDARSSPAAEAVSLGAVDGIASTIDDVVAAANGHVVQVGGHDVTLALAGAPIEEAASTPFQGIIQLLVDPNIAFLLFTVGALMLLFELQSPSVVLGVFGAIAILLSFVGFANLPTNVAGLVLVGIGLVLFALEPAIPSHGLLTVGGLAAFVLGGSALYSQPGPLGPDTRVALPLLIVASVTAAALGLLITTMAIRTRRMTPPIDGPSALVATGTVGLVERPLTPVGSIRAAGEEWSARTADDRPLERGTPVRVVSLDGLTAVVEPAPGALP